jgi:hypothetical protein
VKQFILQCVILAMLAAGFLLNLNRNFNGDPRAHFVGFRGALISIAVTAGIIVLYWQAGALSALFGVP